MTDKYSYQSPYNFQENKIGSGVELEGLELQLAPYLLESLAAAGAGGVVLGTAHTQNAGAQVPDILTINLSETIIVGTVSTASGINNEFNQNSEKSLFGKIISGIASGLNSAWNILNNDSDTASEATDGESSKYENSTNKSKNGGTRTTKNRDTDVPKEEFEKNLENSGFEKSSSKDGKINFFDKNGKRYSTRDTSKSNRPTAEFRKNAKSKDPDIKIRLRE